MFTSSRPSSTTFFSIFSFSHRAVRVAAVSFRILICDVAAGFKRALSVSLSVCVAVCVSVCATTVPVPVPVAAV